MSVWRRVLHLVALVGSILLLYFVVPVDGELNGNAVLRGVVAFLALVALIFVMVRQLGVHLDDMERRVDGLVGTIVIVVVAFALAYYILNLREPHQIDGMETRIDSLYFTMTTLLTVGFGDIHAAGQVARVMVLIQYVFNVVFVATAAGILSSRVRAAVTARAQARSTQRKPT